MKFSISNLGCKVNAFEAESVSESFEEHHWQRVEEFEDSDVVCIFTCAVTNQAAAKSRKVFHRAANLKQPITVVVGCYAQINDGLLDEADIIVGSSHKSEIVQYVEQFQKDHIKIRKLDLLEKPDFEFLGVTHFENHSRGVLKIQDGCNQFCSYCVIPYARGRERSLAPDQVIQEAKRISEHHREIVLTGIHTGRYGKEYGVTLAQLMKRLIDEVPNLQRLRISSIEVTEVSEELIELMKHEPKIARHLHIPIQSGCDEILQKMNRPYNTQQYYDKIMWIRKQLEDCAISCDVIVGFPSETEEQFQTTYDFLKKCAFSFLHVFPYSLRKGTKAALMEEQVPTEVKKQRARTCITLSNELSDLYQSQLVGKTGMVMSELPQGNDTPGYSSDYVHVCIPNDSITRGTMLRVHYTKYENHQLYGEVESVMK